MTNLFMKFENCNLIKLSMTKFYSMTWPNLRLLAEMVFEISVLQVFYVQICKGQQLKKIENGNNSTKLLFPKFSPGNLLIILYQLFKFEAPSCNNFWDVKFSMSKFAKDNNSKTFLNFHPVFFSLSSISWLSLKLPALILLRYLDYKISLLPFKKGIHVTPQRDIIRTKKYGSTIFWFWWQINLWHFKTVN